MRLTIIWWDFNIWLSLISAPTDLFTFHRYYIVVNRMLIFLISVWVHQLKWPHIFQVAHFCICKFDFIFLFVSFQFLSRIFSLKIFNSMFKGQHLQNHHRQTHEHEFLLEKIYCADNMQSIVYILPIIFAEISMEISTLWWQ